MDDENERFAVSPPDGAWDDLNKRAGARLRQLRIDAGMTLEGLRERLALQGIVWHPPTQSRAEQGVRPLRLEEAYAISLIFGVEMSALLEGTEDLDLATLVERQNDALAAIAERQNANQVRLDRMHASRSTIAEHQAIIAEMDREIRKAGAEIEHYQAVVSDLEQRTAKITDGEDETDDAEIGYEEI